MSRPVVKQRGFSLIEALVALVLAGGGIAALVSSMGVMQRSEARILLAEKMQRLAVEKLDEIVATQDTNAQSGDFQDRGVEGFSWTVTDDTTSVENLEKITVQVTKDGDETAVQTVETLIYRPPATTGANG